MKKIFTAILLVTWITQGAQAQRWGAEVGLNYAYTSPLGSMQRNIKQGHGVVMDLGMLTPSRRFAVGMEIQYTMYGNQESLQEYDFGNGTSANMDIVVNNQFMNFMAYGRYYVINKGKVMPYLTAKGGYANYSTQLSVFDPDDVSRCTPSHREVLLREGTMVGSLGAGVQIDMASLFRKAEPGRFYIDFNSSITQGGTVRYMNSDAPAPDRAPAIQAPTDAVSAQVVNPQSQVVHRYHSGTVYTSPVQLLDFRLGARLRIGS